MGNYELLEEIARGGMGVVYRARQLSPERIVALKFILAGTFANREARIRFRNEAETIAQLRHPNIVTIHERGEHDGQPYFSMDYIPGGNLAGLVRQGPLAPRMAVRIVKTLAEAVQHAHDRGVLHRDLKPSNVLLDEAGNPMITDFGLARRIDGDSSLTDSWQVLGSPSFMPPEQAGGGGNSREYSDVYSLGGILFFLLTGRPAFLGGNVPETLRLVLQGDPVSPRVLNPRVPPDLATVCLKCIERIPARRYQTARELADELDRFLRGDPVFARPVGRLDRASRWCRRRPALSAALGLVGLLMLTILIGGPTLAVKAERARRDSDQHRLIAEARLAKQLLDDKNLAGARALLGDAGDRASRNKAHDWEWRYLRHRARSDEVAVLLRADAVVIRVALSRDERHLVAIGEDGTVRVWATEDWRQLSEWTAHPNSILKRPDLPQHNLALCPDGRSLVTGGADGRIRVWTLPRGSLCFELESLGQACARLEFSGDGRRLFALGTDGRVSAWDWSTNHPRQRLVWETRLSLCASLAVSGQGETLWVGGFQAPLQVWQAPEAGPPSEAPGLRDAIPPAVVSPGVDWLVGAGQSGFVARRWRLGDGDEGTHLGTFHSYLTALAVSPDSQWIASGLRDGVIAVSSASAPSDAVIHLGHEGAISSMAFTHDNEHLISASWDGTIRIWNALAPRTNEIRIRNGGAVSWVAFAPSGDVLASVGREIGSSGVGSPEVPVCRLKLWRLPGPELLRETPLHSVQPFMNVRFSPDGSSLAVASDQGLIELLSVGSLASQAVFAGSFPRFDPSSTLVFVRGRQIVSRSTRGGRIGEEEVLVEMPGAVGQLELSPDGRKAVATLVGDNGTTLHFADLSRRRLSGVMPGHASRVGHFEFSPDGSLLASAGWDDLIGFWDAKAPGHAGWLRGHNGSPNAVTFSPDGRTLASAGDDSVRLWNVETRLETARLASGASWYNVDFSADGRWLAASGSDGFIWIWDAPRLEDAPLSAPVRR